MNTTKNNQYSFGFIVPFLNEAIWLECFIKHYAPILERHPDNKLVFIEGATSFHSGGEHRRGLSLDGSEEIISRMKTNQMIHLRAGRVGVLAELLNEGFYQCKQDFIIPLSVHDFISDDFFRLNDGFPLMQLDRIELVGDFRHKGFIISALPIFQNIEGFYFRHNDLIPYFDDIRIDAERNIKHLDFSAINVEKIENRYQFERRQQRGKRIREWYHKRVKPITMIDYIEEKEKRMAPNIEEYSGFIPDALKAHPWYGKKSEEIWNTEAIFPEFKRQKTSVARTGKKILEIGCATGQTLTYYKDRGWQAIGIEPSLWASGYGRHILNVDVRHGTALDFEFPLAEFSIIAFWDSFEHVPDPVETLKHLKVWLEDNGKLIIYTPNFNKFKDEKRHFLWSPRQHICLYTPETLRKMLEKVGFRITSTDRRIDNNGFLMVAQKDDNND